VNGTYLFGSLLLAAAQASTPAAQPAAGPTVTMDNFTRAETDNYFATFVKEGGLGKVAHSRELADVKDLLSIATLGFRGEARADP